MVEYAFIKAGIFFEDAADGIFNRTGPDHIINDSLWRHIISPGSFFQPIFRPGQTTGISIHAAHRIHEDVIAAVAAKHIGQRIEDSCLFIVFIVG